ncbi:unnamed protein product [Rotaria sordida]|uniref:Charged multivesicular body protein 5 n=1 Tax=Rotaria sordida TaxID=392033 RepID=A0A814KMM2_9BILA|nr:unnamed protein product [Rotaria sordida]CAF1053386.1 unnamed protein product [Rotaria sordida]
MSRLFGWSKSNTIPKPTLNDTAATLDLRVETINKQIAIIDHELQAYNKLPPARKASQKSRAMALLNKKKMYERQRMTIEGQSANIAATTFGISNIAIHKEMYHGLKDAKNQLAKGYKDLKIEKVETLMDDLDDQLLDQDEMNDTFSRTLGQDTYITDADLENELADLATEESGIQSNARYTDLHVPSVPVQPIDTRNKTGVTTKNGTIVGLPKAPVTGMKN